MPAVGIAAIDALANAKMKTAALPMTWRNQVQIHTAHRIATSGDTQGDRVVQEGASCFREWTMSAEPLSYFAVKFPAPRKRPTSRDRLQHAEECAQRAKIECSVTVEEVSRVLSGVLTTGAFAQTIPDPPPGTVTPTPAIRSVGPECERAGFSGPFATVGSLEDSDASPRARGEVAMPVVQRPLIAAISLLSDW